MGVWIPLDSWIPYIAIVAQLAEDLPRLEELRRTLRQRMMQSPLMTPTASHATWNRPTDRSGADGVEIASDVSHVINAHLIFNDDLAAGVRRRQRES
jgi:hypothetical protein